MSGRAVVLGLLLLAPAAVHAADGEGPVVFREDAKASVYGDHLQGKKTASGKRFDQRAPTVAHPTLPLGSEVTLTNPETGKEVEAEVTDRGPHAKGRDVDLSKSAARAIGVSKDIAEEGDTTVRIEATQDQVEQAIGSPAEVERVERELRQARRKAAREGTPQPSAVPSLDPPS